MTKRALFLMAAACPLAATMYQSAIGGPDTDENRVEVRGGVISVSSVAEAEQPVVKEFVIESQPAATKQFIIKSDSSAKPLPAEKTAKIQIEARVAADHAKQAEEAVEQARKVLGKSLPAHVDHLMHRGMGVPAGEFNYTYSVSDGDKNAGEIRKLEHEVARLASDLGKESDTQKKVELAGKIEALLVKQFDLRQSSREEELKSLEERVKKLRENFDRRNGAKNEIVKHRLDEIIREADGLGWGETAQFDAVPKGQFRVPFGGGGGSTVFGTTIGPAMIEKPSTATAPKPVAPPAPPAAPSPTR